MKQSADKKTKKSTEKAAATQSVVFPTEPIRPVPPAYLLWLRAKRTFRQHGHEPVKLPAAPDYRRASGSVTAKCRLGKAGQVRFK